VPSIALAITVDLLLVALQRRLTPWSNVRPTEPPAGIGFGSAGVAPAGTGA
jgi:hypothetical protein